MTDDEDTTELKGRPPDDERDVEAEDVPDVGIDHPTADIDDEDDEDGGDE